MSHFLSSLFLCAYVLPSIAVFFFKDVTESETDSEARLSGIQRHRASKVHNPVVYAKEHCKKIAFVHVRKTGGTTLLSLFGQGHTHLGSKDIPARKKMPRGLPLLRYLFLGSHKVSETAASMRSRIGEREWAKAYTVAFVRDPYDYLASNYFFYLWGAANKKGEKKAALSLLAQRADLHGALHHELQDYLHGPGETLLRNYTNLPIEDPRHKIGLEMLVRHIAKSETGISLHTQLERLADAHGNILVQHVMKTGSVEQKRFLSCRGILEQVCPDGKALAARIPHCSDETASPINVSPQDHDYIKYYSPETCALVAFAFSRDFDTFGFDKSRCPHY
eukprot:TRINITY_DN2322_c0_g1_i1.p1 TRINITY_DN2322_c0_g1~~TRINITY_DN2322_c0_g1_i1.p1  ORF type:complete len:335 (-),score=26.75 TRINITY_DN2322_c0_g1_i1:125-1129(-)